MTNRLDAVTAPAIEVLDLVKVYPSGRKALDKVSFAVRRGEIFGFLGPNGSGKTTTVRILATLLRRTTGQVLVCGVDPERRPDDVHRLIGYAGQSNGIDIDMTAHENLMMQGLLHGLKPTQALERCEELLEVFSLSDVANQRAARFSGGMQRKLDLAQALMHHPAVLFLDEPTTGLDPQSRTALWHYLRSLAQGGTTVFLTTQQMEEADRICDRVAIIEEGQVVRIGSPEELKREMDVSRLVLRFADADDLARAETALASSPSITRSEIGDELTLYVPNPAAALPRIVQELYASGLSPSAIEQREPTLDDVFLHYTGRRPHTEALKKSSSSGMFAAAHGRRGGR